MDNDSLSVDQAIAFVRRFRRLAAVAVSTLVIGAAFYHQVEHWSWLDSFYFSVVSLSTVGYGDLVPTTDLGKLFTIFYLVVGIGIFAALVNNLVKSRTLHKHIKKISGEPDEQDVKLKD